MTRKIALLLSSLIILLSICACTPPTITLCSGGRQGPEKCVEGFFDCLKRDDYAGADAHVQNLTTLGFGEAMPEGLYSQLYQYLRDSRSCVVVEQDVSAVEATVTIDLTTLDFRKIESALTDTVTAKVAEIEFEGVEVDDTQLAQLIQTTLTELMQNPATYYSTERFALQTFYDEGEWKLVCTDDFYSALVGYVV